MPMPQSHFSPALSLTGGLSTRAAVNDIFRTTEALLAGFRQDFHRKSRDRQLSTQAYVNGLRHTVQKKMADLHDVREESAVNIRAQLKDYVEELKAEVAHAQHDARMALKGIAATRAAVAPKLVRQRAKDCERTLDELQKQREHDTTELHGDLKSLVENLREKVVQMRDAIRHDLGVEEPVLHGKKTAKQPADAVRKEQAITKSAPLKVSVSKKGIAAAASDGPAKVQPSKKAKMTRKGAARAASKPLGGKK